MNKTESYINNLNLADIPWSRLTTPYGRATDFPQYFEAMSGSDLAAIKEANKQLYNNIEHQSTLWSCTPFATIFLLRLFKKSIDHLDQEPSYYLAQSILDMFEMLADEFQMGSDMDHADPLPNFSDILDEKYIWPETSDPEDDDLFYEDEEFFPDDLFYSFYFYTYQVILCCKPLLAKVSHPDLQKKVNALSQLLL